MNKKRLALLVLPILLLTSCGMFSDNSEGGNTPKEIEFEITSASFLDEEGHLKVNYTCNYDSPFEVEGYEFSKLNISGVTASEVDTTKTSYFTALSHVKNTTLKFEFYDTNGKVYISTRFNDVKPYGVTPDPDPDPDPDPQEDPIDYPSGYDTLYWSDEFDGDSLDTSNWTHQIGNGDGGWGNGESQYYTNSNDIVSNGELIIRAKKESMGGFSYTSTRIITQNNVHFTYGYVEARIALPNVNGMWPAFWMMPNDSVYGGWPHSGEIDIMEAKGRLPSSSSSALHFATNNGQHTYLSNEKSGHNITEYHKYAVEWKLDTIRYLIDDICHLSINKSQWGTDGALSSETAPFDKDFYIILNLAVGGHFDNWILPPDNFVSCDMKVDYVRVFK